MAEIVRTNQIGLIAAIEALLAEAEIPYQVADRNMSVLEGSIGILPRRLMVRDEDLTRAERAMRDNDIDLGQ